MDRHLDRLLEWYRIERAIVREALRQGMRNFYKTFSRRCHRIMPSPIWAAHWDGPLEPGPMEIESGYDGEAARPLADIRWRISTLYAEGDGAARRSRWAWGESWPHDHVPPAQYMAFGELKHDAVKAYQERFRELGALRNYFHALRARFEPILIDCLAIAKDRPSQLESNARVRYRLDRPMDLDRSRVLPLNPGPFLDAMTRRLSRQDARMRERERRWISDGF